MKKIIATLLAAMMVVGLLAGCGDKAGSDTATTKAPESQAAPTSAAIGVSQTTAAVESTSNAERKDVVIAMASEAGTFNPFKSSAAGWTRIRNVIYQGLAFRNAEKGLDPIIAKSWTMSEDGLTCDLEIKDNVYDSKGNHLTADDVVFSCMQHYADNGKMTYKYNVPDKMVEKTGEYTVRFNFTQPTVSGLDSILTQTTIITSAGCNGDPANLTNEPCGTGPYVLTNYVVNNELTFEKNENYWMKDDPHPYYTQNLDKITYKIIPEAASRAIELETGAVDFVFDPQATDLDRISGNADLGVIKGNFGSTLNMYCNTTALADYPATDGMRTGALGDVRMRQAVAYAIDTGGLALAVTEGLGDGAYSVAHPVTMEWRDRYFERGYLYAQDLDKAKALAEEAATDGGPMAFHIMTDEDAAKRTAATIIKEVCSQIGVEVTVDSLESAVFQSRYGDRTQWDAYMGNSMANIYTTSFMTTQMDRCDDPDKTQLAELREAVNKAFEVYDEATADKAVELWERDLPIIPLVTRETAFMYRQGLTFELTFEGQFYPQQATWK